MSIMPYSPAVVDPEWHTDEPTPLDCLVAPAEDGPVGFPGDADDLIALVDRPGPESLPRYRVEPIESKAMGRVLFWVIDAAEGRKVSWFAVERNALDLASDLNAEDWPDCGRWWEVQAPSEHFDRPVRLAGAPSQAVADRTIDRLALVEYPPF
jgi:hypothetical protein